MKPNFAASFNTNWRFLSAPVGLPIGTNHSEVKRHLWYSGFLYGLPEVTRSGFSMEYGGVNCTLATKFDPLLGKVGSYTEERCKAILKLTLLEVPLSNPEKMG